jgi:hypothetical protein
LEKGKNENRDVKEDDEGAFILVTGGLLFISFVLSLTNALLNGCQDCRSTRTCNTSSDSDFLYNRSREP